MVKLVDTTLAKRLKEIEKQVRLIVDGYHGLVENSFTYHKCGVFSFTITIHYAGD